MKLLRDLEGDPKTDEEIAVAQIENSFLIATLWLTGPGRDGGVSAEIVITTSTGSFIAEGGGTWPAWELFEAIRLAGAVIWSTKLSLPTNDCQWVFVAGRAGRGVSQVQVRLADQTVIAEAVPLPLSGAFVIGCPHQSEMEAIALDGRFQPIAESAIRL